MRSMTEKSILCGAHPVLLPPETEASADWTYCTPDTPYFMVGIENSAPSLTPEGQREVTVLVRV